MPYRGRVAPSPTGYLHLGHGRTFWQAYRRAQQASGALVLRAEDLDPQRSQPEFARAMMEDLKWLGIEWQEGPDVGGPFAPYQQSRRREFYVEAWRELRRGGFVYPCFCSRRDLAQAPGAPHEAASAADDAGDEPVYPGTCRGRSIASDDPRGCNWRFRVPEGRTIAFADLRMGSQHFVAGRDFGDFVLWRRDDVPAYQLAVVVDDAAMQITEVVRGADLLKSTARQMLLIEAMGLPQPAYFHCDLLRDPAGRRLAKRHESLSLRELRRAGYTPGQVRKMWHV
ncbi:MAG: tRNA glutamyl-Q(34) synthetase GluQRS [Acidobacteria bacterium]|nr:tRNA glutamyl-Q(34) synthetase GluQRS [Acidobacteriota bacterium]